MNLLHACICSACICICICIEYELLSHAITARALFFLSRSWEFASKKQLYEAPQNAEQVRKPPALVPAGLGRLPCNT